VRREIGGAGVWVHWREVFQEENAVHWPEVADGEAILNESPMEHHTFPRRFAKISFDN
jgi:hypothetical protein